MSSAWYYSHDGATHGPFTEEELKDRAARKMLLESDWVWEGIGERRYAVPANVVFDFAPLPSVVSPIPDWLADVAEVERKGPLPGVMPTDEIPEWLEDLRLWVGLDVYAPTRQDSKEITEPPPSVLAQRGAIPDWLENWTTPERPKPSGQKENAPVLISPPPCDKPAPSSQPAQPAIVAKKEASPAKTEPPVSTPTQPAKTVPSTPLLEKADKTFSPTSIAPKPPIVVPTQLPTASSAPATTPATTSRLADSIRQMSGFDMETGQILDPEKFRKWKQQNAHPSLVGQPAVSNASLIEIFRKARTAIEKWIDDDANRLCVMQAEIADIGRKPEIQNILNEYDGYGKEMRDKLLRHLAFMVQNRKKFYKAVEGRLAH